MVTLPDGKRKVELDLSDNKDIAIQSILGIRIKSFRSLKNQSLILGEHVTVPARVKVVVASVMQPTAE